ncbi:hypothetical protein KI387_028301 [Taxus chinensis]|uniref:Uncharacterized protein n=1 Tax=Taxus chinensis TaxID=29808 RepID=A0AA38L576_TAXCH|nr:hypothetical protein KI387_028301 [Taxus chinensis]
MVQHSHNSIISMDSTFATNKYGIRGNTYGETSGVNEDTFRLGPSSSYPTSEVEGGSNAAETSPRRRLSFNNLASAQGGY